MVNVVWGDTSKPVATGSLAAALRNHPEIDGTLYIGYPIVGTAEGAYNLDAVLLSHSLGILAFDVVEGAERTERMDIQDEIFVALQSRLLQYKPLVSNRALQVPLSVITYAPAWSESEGDTGRHIATDIHALIRLVNAQIRPWKADTLFVHLTAAIQSVTHIRPASKRPDTLPVSSRAGKLRRLEQSIANLDATQSTAVIETVEGVQRIRGLAGSGKTIILALKVAYIHAKHPDWHIAVTFNTRSLKGFFRDLITRFTLEYKRDVPDWEVIEILHGWGSAKSEGLYYRFCKEHNIVPLTLRQAVVDFGRGDPLGSVCEQVMREVAQPREMFDFLVVDEAQDFSKWFMRLCYTSLKSPKRLVYAYDELQSLNDQQVESPEDLFGLDENGLPRVRLRNEPNRPKQDIILERCYRNPRPVLVTAHALGFGIYRDEGMVQMFDASELWTEIGYEVEAGALGDGCEVTLARTAETSPRFLEDHSSVDDLIVFNRFNNQDEQAQWVAEQIRGDLESEFLRPEDILVVTTDALTAESDLGPLRSRLYEMGIASHIAGTTTSPDEFMVEHSVTTTGIYRAKGNEAGMVYIINAQNCVSGRGLSRKRNILFTAITRSRAWVRICGYGQEMDVLEGEFKRVRAEDFHLRFFYPTPEQRKTMRVVHRDMTQSERAVLRTQVRNVNDFIKALNSGTINIDDVPKDVLKRLKDVITYEAE